MDIGLPDGDGCDFVKKLRATGFMKPVIMLTGRDAEDDVVAGLDAGANDYVSKPFQFSILLARIRAHLRQHEFSEDVSLKMATYTFYPGSKILVGSTGAKTRLTEKETAVLRYLHRANGGVVSRDELLREVWGYNARVSTHTLETHIYRLRQKIAAVPGAANLLVTDIGGYRLEA
jgi:DNA-binding response OmpR family regulator